MSEDLTQKKCVPCEGGDPPLTQAQVQAYLPQISDEWQVEDNKKIQREFTFADFKRAMGFVNRIAEIAEDEGHHPDLYIFYNKVRVELWTHAVKGLSENDFIIAAKIDQLLNRAS